MGKFRDMSYSCSYLPQTTPVIYFSNKATVTILKKLYFSFSIVMRKRVAGLTPTLQSVRWASCLTAEWFLLCSINNLQLNKPGSAPAGALWRELDIYTAELLQGICVRAVLFLLKHGGKTSCKVCSGVQLHRLCWQQWGELWSGPGKITFHMLWTIFPHWLFLSWPGEVASLSLPGNLTMTIRLLEVTGPSQEVLPHITSCKNHKWPFLQLHYCTNWTD